MADDLSSADTSNSGAATLDATASGESAGFDTSAASAGASGSDAALAPDASAPSIGTYNAAPVPSAPSISADDIARANAQYLAPVLQQLAPKPEAPKHPWNDPSAYWSMAGVPEDRAHAEFDRRLEQRTAAVAESLMEKRLNAALDEQRKQFAAALAWQEQQFGARFAADPAFARIESHFKRYVSEGVPPGYARRLAELDAGIIGRPAAAASPAAPAAPAASVPLPPRSATSPATRTAAPAAPGKKPWKNVNDRAEFEARFNALADQIGVQ